MILHQHVSVTPVIIMSVSYNKNTINLQVIMDYYKCAIGGLSYKYKIFLNARIWNA